jgi:hypothetical protein
MNCPVVGSHRHRSKPGPCSLAPTGAEVGSSRMKWIVSATATSRHPTRGPTWSAISPPSRPTRRSLKGRISLAHFSAQQLSPKTARLPVVILIAFLIIFLAAGLIYVRRRAAPRANATTTLAVKVQGNSLVDGSGTPIRLLGVDRSAPNMPALRGGGSSTGPLTPSPSQRWRRGTSTPCGCH